MKAAAYARIVPYTRPPPTIDMAQALGLMISEWARTIGKAKPVTTIKAVMKRPKSTGPEPSSKLVAYSSAPQQCGKTAFGSGARTKVNATRRGSQFCHKAQDRMMRRNPTASTKESSITVLSPAPMEEQCTGCCVNVLMELTISNTT